MKAQLLLVVVEADDAKTVERLIDQLARAACDIANSEDESASIIIEESTFNLVPGSEVQ